MVRSAALRMCAALAALLLMQPALADTTPVPGLKPSGIKRCLNFGNALEAPYEGAWGYVIQQTDIRKARLAGYDAIRIPMAWGGRAAPTAPYALDPAFVARVDQVVGWALAEGLSVIVDFHSYQVFDLNPQGELPRFIGIWGNIATHFKGASPKVYFELMNEPGNKVPDGFMDTVNKQVIAEIRKTNPTRKIIYGNNWWNNWQHMVTLTPIADPNVIAVFHYYDPITFTHQGVDFGSGPLPFPVTWGTTAEVTSLKADFTAIAAWGAQNNQAVMLTEFGVIATVPATQRAAWYQTVRQAAQRRGIGWCAWALHSEFDVMNSAGAWIPELRKALLGR